MRNERDMIRRFLGSEEAVTAVEYAVMLAALILFILSTLVSFSETMKGFFGGVKTNVDNLPGG